jgi:hypothetical protein
MLMEDDPMLFYTLLISMGSSLIININIDLT